MLTFALGWRVPASTPTGLVSPLNMTLSDGTLYVSDQFTGVHVYDVADPAAPRAVTTIALDGNRGSAVKDDILYASEKNKLHVYRREGDTFTLVTTLESEYDYDGGDVPWNEGPDEYSFACVCGTRDESPVMPASQSGGSSYATFAVIDDYLYRVDRYQLVVYDIQAPAAPVELQRLTLDWTIETIYPTPEYLFIGGESGMFVCDRADPANPDLIGMVQHIRACDPVVVSGDIAYVTVRGGNQCGASPDELMIVDVSSPSAPRVVGVKPLATPHGLALREPFLYVSTGQSGYTLLDVTRPTAPAELEKWADWPTKDFLWSNDLLYVLGFDDLRIYDVSDPKTPILKSTIENDPS
jgi:hypothetical protein